MISFSSGFNGFKIFVAIFAGLSLYPINGSLASDIGPLVSDYVSITIVAVVVGVHHFQRLGCFFLSQPAGCGNISQGLRHLLLSKSAQISKLRLKKTVALVKERSALGRRVLMMAYKRISSLFVTVYSF